MAANRDELDAILEKGIASYPEAEPLAGMEERIIARIGMAKMPRRSVIGWRAVWAVGFAAVAITGLVLIRTGQIEPRPVAVAVVNRPPHFEPTPVQISEPQRRPHIAHVHRVRALPKGPVFPTPSPLTRQERLMVTLVSENPDEAAQVLDSLRQGHDEPIAIAPIVIPPIPMSDEQ
ncbi:MAG TPA: hypothetical protein VGG97_00675 [Bryobacteraceae bacterium]|jgi:hypothetical protein